MTLKTHRRRKILTTTTKRRKGKRRRRPRRRRRKSTRGSDLPVPRRPHPQSLRNGRKLSWNRAFPSNKSRTLSRNRYRTMNGIVRGSSSSDGADHVTGVTSVRKTRGPDRQPPLPPIADETGVVKDEQVVRDRQQHREIATRLGAVHHRKEGGGVGAEIGTEGGADRRGLDGIKRLFKRDYTGRDVTTNLHTDSKCPQPDIANAIKSKSKEK